MKPQFPMDEYSPNTPVKEMAAVYDGGRLEVKDGIVVDDFAYEGGIPLVRLFHACRIDTKDGHVHLFLWEN